MPSVKVRDNEPFDVALRRFKRSCEKAGVLLNYAVASTMRSRLLSVNAKRQLP